MKSISIEQETVKEISCLYTEDDGSKFIHIFKKDQFNSEKELMESIYNFSTPVKISWGIINPKTKYIDKNNDNDTVIEWDDVGKDFVEKIAKTKKPQEPI